MEPKVAWDLLALGVVGSLAAAAAVDWLVCCVARVWRGGRK